MAFRFTINGREVTNPAARMAAASLLLMVIGVVLALVLFVLLPLVGVAVGLATGLAALGIGVIGIGLPMLRRGRLRGLSSRSDNDHRQLPPRGG